MPPVVYLATPIDRAGESTVLIHEVVSELCGEMTGLGWGVFTPTLAWSVGRSLDERLQASNEAILRQCDGMLVFVPMHTPSVGVWLEVGIASSLGIPVAVIYDCESWALTGTPGVEQFDSTVAGFDGAVRWLKEQMESRSVSVRGVAKFAGSGDLPTRAYEDDAGWDLYYHGDVAVTIAPGEGADIPAGLAVEWPFSMWSIMIGRSSTFRNKGLMVNIGVIDAGYRGPLFAVVRNISNNHVVVSPGDRIAQLIPMTTHSLGMVARKVSDDELSLTARNTAGFGSSG